mmetsp:Transcript_19803/g.78870  ORF Transcript_19803/g.78870 Transcript_19803/m.78870 type:complete len:191 (+) Transcript_19803:5665-6237(+)
MEPARHWTHLLDHTTMFPYFHAITRAFLENPLDCSPAYFSHGPARTFSRIQGDVSTHALGKHLHACSSALLAALKTLADFVNLQYSACPMQAWSLRLIIDYLSCHSKLSSRVATPSPTTACTSAVLGHDLVAILRVHLARMFATCISGTKSSAAVLSTPLQPCCGDIQRLSACFDILNPVLPASLRHEPC